MALDAGNIIINSNTGTVVSGKDVSGGYFVTASLDVIPAYSNVEGAICLNKADNKFYTFNGTTWVEANIATKTELNTKQDTLTAGTGIDITNNVISNTQTSAEWGNITGTLSSQTDLQTALNAKANSADLATVATTGSYNDLTNKPTIPTVNDGTITITQGGVTKGTFTVNQSGNTTVALDGGGSGTSDFDTLTNRPSYNGSAMTHTTDIPEVKTSTWDAKQDALVSGTNIKTINSNSLLGSGDIEVQDEVEVTGTDLVFQPKTIEDIAFLANPAYPTSADLPYGSSTQAIQFYGTNILGRTGHFQLFWYDPVYQLGLLKLSDGSLQIGNGSTLRLWVTNDNGVTWELCPTGTYITASAGTYTIDTESGVKLTGTRIYSEDNTVTPAVEFVHFTEKSWENVPAYKGEIDKARFNDDIYKFKDLDARTLIAGKQDTITSSNKLSYNLLSDTPTIPTKTSDLTNDSGFIDNTYHDSTKQDNVTESNNNLSFTTGNFVALSNSNYPTEASLPLGNNTCVVQFNGTLSDTTTVATGLVQIFFHNGGSVAINQNSITVNANRNDFYIYSSSDNGVTWVLQEHNTASVNYKMYTSSDVQEATANIISTDITKITTSYTKTSGVWEYKDFISGAKLADGIYNFKDINAQEKLISGTNIKTINNTSILGSGDISIDAPANMVTTDTVQTITANKTFSGDTITFAGRKIILNATFDSSLLPLYSNARELGSSSNKWKNLYLAGNLTDGTNSTTIANIVSNLPLTATTLPATAVVNTIYDLGEQSTVTLALPTGQLGNWVEVGFISGAIATTLTITSTAGLSEWTATIDANAIYTIFAEWGRLDSSTYGWLLSYKKYTKANV